VLNAQTDLASAQLSEVSAVADYQIDQVDLAQATGVVLGQAHIDWEPAPAPRP
jgi:outer membrane protein TolC